MLRPDPGCSIDEVQTRVVNTLYDNLWKRLMEIRSMKVTRPEKVDERQLFIF